MDGKEMTELRELVEFLKANDVAEFDMEREDLKVRLKFAGAPGASNVDVAHLAQLMAASQTAAVIPAAVAPTQSAQTAAAPSVQASSEAGAAGAVPDPTAGAHIVKSPIVGTFYDAPSPDAEVFVKVGDTVRSGQVLCIVEAMKLMNEIESDAAGEVIKVFVIAGQPVEYGQPLYAIKK